MSTFMVGSLIALVVALIVAMIFHSQLVDLRSENRRLRSSYEWLDKQVSDLYHDTHRAFDALGLERTPASPRGWKMRGLTKPAATGADK